MSSQELNGQNSNVRTFTGTSLREALADVRRDMGPDALIMGQRKMGSRIAVDACLEMPAVNVPEVNVPGPLDVPDPALQGSDALPVMLAKEDSLVVPESTGNPPQNAHETLFTAAGYHPGLVAEVPGCDDIEQFRHAVTTRLNYAHRSIRTLAGAYRFIGVGGVGKSSTLIRVLVEWVGLHHARDVVVVSTDQERLAGTEALQLTCQMLNVTMHECASKALPETLKRYASKTLILVDSPAMQLNKPLTSIAGLKDMWVCSALHSEANLKLQHRHVQSIRPAGLVVSQIDQSAAGDQLANLLYEWRLPLYWLCNSPQLPGGLHDACADATFANFFPDHAGRDQAVTLDVAV